MNRSASRGSSNLLWVAGVLLLGIHDSSAQAVRSVEDLLKEPAIQASMQCVGVIDGWFGGPALDRNPPPDPASAELLASFQGLFRFFVDAAAEHLVDAGIPRNIAEAAVVEANERRVAVVAEIMDLMANPPNDGVDHDGAIRTLMVAVGSCLYDACWPLEAPPAGDACAPFVEASRRQ